MYPFLLYREEITVNKFSKLLCIFHLINDIYRKLTRVIGLFLLIPIIIRKYKSYYWAEELTKTAVFQDQTHFLVGSVGPTLEYLENQYRVLCYLSDSLSILL